MARMGDETSVDIIQVKFEDPSSVVFLTGGKHIIVGGGGRGVDKKIWRLGAEDGKKVGPPPMDTQQNCRVDSIAVSPDGTWVVMGRSAQPTTGFVVIWDAESLKPAIKFTVHDGNNHFIGRACVSAVDVSPDGKRIAGGSSDGTAFVWTLAVTSTHLKRLIGPLIHDSSVVSVKFSPDGHLIATATWNCDAAIRIYDSHSGHLLVKNVPVQVELSNNLSVAWAKDGKQLYILSLTGEINCLDVSTGRIVSKWTTLSDRKPKCIVLSSGGRFIAVSNNSLVSFWDVVTHKQIGSVIKHNDTVDTMAISENYDIVVGGAKTVTIRSLRGLLPASYIESVSCVSVKQTSAIKSSSAPGFVVRCVSLLLESRAPNLKVQDPSPKPVNWEDDADYVNRYSIILDNKLMRDEKTCQDLRCELAALQRDAIETEASLRSTIQSLETQVGELQQKVKQKDELIRIHEQKHHCEALYSAGRTSEAALFFVQITDSTNEEVQSNEFLMGWLTEFTDRCVSALEEVSNNAMSTGRFDEALEAYSILLALNSSPPENVLAKWTSTVMTGRSVDATLQAAAKLRLPRSMICRVVCNVLVQGGHTTEAVAYLHQMQCEPTEDAYTYERAQWEPGFRYRLAAELGKLADAAMESHQSGEAVKHLSAILSLDGVDRMDALVKRSSARALMSSWVDALSDADEVIELDPSSYLGYERRHLALNGAGRHAEAIVAFETMLLRLEQSPSQEIRGLRSRYIDARPAIRRIVNQMLYRLPRLLIETTSGRLYDKKQQASAFEVLPIWNELVSSMTREVDYGRIRQAVKEFSRYVMLSHTWEEEEPVLQTVKNISVYDLEASPTNQKLREFCSLARSKGFQWAWADTTCIDQDNNVVLQESLVAMFTWYRGSALTLIYLRDVWSTSSQLGGLRRSKWNTRGWTYQEYVAAKAVQFYTGDWKPYLGLELANHKDSPNIISEMQQATSVSAQDMAILQPGLDKVREKLFVASTRQTTRVEDAAYSLLGIFNISIPVIYGEGDRAVGRLLEHILTGSGDVSVLAWTGRAGSYNSCLPIDLTVYNELIPVHIPLAMKVDEMEGMVRVLRSSLPDLANAVSLYNQLNVLPPVFLAATRLRLPCIAFNLGELVNASEPDPVTMRDLYHGSSSSFGHVEIRTAEDLTGKRNLCLVHPWVRPLLDHEFSHDSADMVDETTQVLWLIARLRQPFGALLLEPLTRVEYRRVAPDSLIMVRLLEEVLLTDLMKNVRVVEIR